MPAGTNIQLESGMAEKSGSLDQQLFLPLLLGLAQGIRRGQQR
jgi:hypothetical protein